MRSMGYGSRTRTTRKKSRHRRDAASLDNLEALIAIGPFERNRVTRSQIDKLRNMIDSDGTEKVAKELGVSTLTLFRVCSGFAHQCQARTAAKIREYFG